MNEPTRREFVQAAAALSVTAAGGLPSLLQAAETSKANAAFEYQHTPAPLPFDPKRLPGLSEKLLQSHWENNYGGSVRALNVVRNRLQKALSDADTPPYIYNDLKREQLMSLDGVTH